MRKKNEKKIEKGGRKKINESFICYADGDDDDWIWEDDTVCI